ncbi:zinc finger protein 761-like isoform X1 [Lineus longissimus]|uniref:zinc finger protein 761-like isoform X1 n=1 Tax=Lineus longissimus TaxID=88925 RepID=UPI00315D4DBF
MILKDGIMSVAETEEEFSPIQEYSPSEGQDESCSFENMQTELHCKGAVLTKAWSDLFRFITKYQAELVMKENSVEIAGKEIEERKKHLEVIADSGHDETLQDVIYTKERMLRKAQSELDVKDRMLQEVQSELSSNTELLEKSQCDLLKKQNDLVQYRGNVEQLKSELNVKQEQIKIKDTLLKKLQNQLMKENAELKEQLELERRALQLEKQSHDLTKRTMSSPGLNTRKRARMSADAATVVEISDSPPTLDLSDRKNFGLSNVISKSESQTQSSEQGRRVSSRLKSRTSTSRSSTDHSSHLHHMPPASTSSSQVTYTTPQKDAKFPETFMASQGNNAPVSDSTGVTSDTYFPLSVSEDTKLIDISSMKVDSDIQGDVPPVSPSASDNEGDVTISELIQSPEGSTDAKNQNLEVRQESDGTCLKMCSSPKKYTCRIGDEAFPSKQSLGHHILVHSTEAHKCSQCEKAYITKWRLQQHMLIHTGEKPYECEDCDFFSKKVAALRVHMRNEHGKIHEFSGLPFSKPAPIASAVVAAQISSQSSQSLDSNIVADSEAILEEESNFVIGSQKIRCDLCDLVFPSAQSLVEHRQTHVTVISGSSNRSSESEIIASSEVAVERSILRVKLRRCDELVPISKQTFRVNQRTHTDEPSNQYESDTVVSSSESAGQEESNLDSCSQDVYCSVCNLVLPSERSLRLHRRTHTDMTNDKSHVCSVCDETFQRADDLQKHELVHKVQKTFVCPFCQETCQSKIDLQNHILLHGDKSKSVPDRQDRGEKSKSNTLECSICHKWFVSQSVLKVHLTSHTDERPWECSICNKRFRQRAGRDKHELIHKGIKPVQCPVCQKDFRAKFALQHHMRVHNKKPRNEQCPVCGKLFATKGLLKSHQRSHSNDCPWECSTCGKFFKTRGGRSFHQMNHTGEKPFKCDLCKKSFRTKFEFRFHVMYHARMAGKKPKPNYFRPRVETLQDTAVDSQEISTAVAGSTDVLADVANTQILTGSLGTQAIIAEGADPDMFLIKTVNDKQMALIKIPQESQRAVREAAGVIHSVEEGQTATAGLESGQSVVDSQISSATSSLTLGVDTNMTKNPNAGPNVYKCNVCQKVFMTQRLLDVHMCKKLTN